ncbi:MAG: response regulator transcription factor [Sphingobacteriaceae bacterium]
MQKKITIALVEDDDNLRFLVSHRLKVEGYEVLEAADGKQGEAMITSCQPDIVLLDWMLPEKQGIEVCRDLRKAGYDKLIIMMTAKAQEVDKIDAYGSGISDYVTKPFNMDLLVTMIQNKVTYFINNEKTEVHTFGDIAHHPNVHLLYKNDKKIELTILENRILLYFLKHIGQVVTREELMLQVWGYQADVNTRTLDMHIVRLRKKIETDPEQPLYLQTVRGVGYKFLVD